MERKYGMDYELECDIVGIIYEMIEEAVQDGELDEEYAVVLKENPSEAMRWLEDNEGMNFNGAEPIKRIGKR